MRGRRTGPASTQRRPPGVESQGISQTLRRTCCTTRSRRAVPPSLPPFAPRTPPDEPARHPRPSGRRTEPPLTPNHPTTMPRRGLANPLILASLLVIVLVVAASALLPVSLRRQPRSKEVWAVARFEDGVPAMPNPWFDIPTNRGPLCLADLTPFSNLGGANLAGCDWRSVRLRGVFVEDCDFRGADLRGAVLSDGTFDAGFGIPLNCHTYVANCDLRGADLCGADLSEAVITNCNFRGAVYDKSTCWPPGFDPVKAGARWDPPARSHP